ncbi:MAG: TIGR00730 family Rossman fold protein [Chloroflexi bacterium]|nr:TIGR00730 family Rossman fold protein [Chloroflexota bacterium]
MADIRSVCVYSGSSDHVPATYFDAARWMGRAIASRGWRLVYGGGSTGLMGAVADAALEAGGEVIGVIPEHFYTPQLAHTGLTRLEVVPDMHTRKARMAELADAFVALPGGLGTLEELFEALTWAQIGLHHKPVGLLNWRGFYDALLAFLDRATQDGFLYQRHRDLLLVAETPESLLDALMTFEHPRVPKWGA